MPGKFICERCGKKFKSNRARSIHMSYEDRIARGETVSVFGKSVSGQVNAPDHIPLEQHVNAQVQPPNPTSGLTSESEHEVAVRSPAPRVARALAPQAPPMQASGQDAGEVDPPQWFIDQLMDPAAKERAIAMKAAYTARQSGQYQEQPPAPAVTIQQNYGPQQGASAPPPPPEEDTVVDAILKFAKEGFNMFKDWRAEKKAALIPKEPSFAELIGQRAIARFADSLSTAQGKATGTRLGKTEPAEGNDIDGLITKQDLVDAFSKARGTAVREPQGHGDEHIPV